LADEDRRTIHRVDFLRRRAIRPHRLSQPASRAVAAGSWTRLRQARGDPRHDSDVLESGSKFCPVLRFWFA
jgi:hypothetical protein